MTVLCVRPDACPMSRRLTIAALALAGCLVVAGPRIAAQDTPSLSRGVEPPDSTRGAPLTKGGS